MPLFSPLSPVQMNCSGLAQAIPKLRRNYCPGNGFNHCIPPKGAKKRKNLMFSFLVADIVFLKPLWSTTNFADWPGVGSRASAPNILCNHRPTTVQLAEEPGRGNAACRPPLLLGRRGLGRGGPFPERSETPRDFVLSKLRWRLGAWWVPHFWLRRFW